MTYLNTKEIVVIDLLVRKHRQNQGHEKNSTLVFFYNHPVYSADAGVFTKQNELIGDRFGQ
jgi:hypothetical protein